MKYSCSGWVPDELNDVSGRVGGGGRQHILPQYLAVGAAPQWAAHADVMSDSDQAGARGCGWAGQDLSD